MGNLAEADELMQQWAYETFDGDNIPMCDVHHAEAVRKDDNDFFWYIMDIG